MNIHFRNISVLLTLSLTLSCSNPTGIQKTDSDNATPDAVIESLISSYNNRNLDIYLRNFSEDCQFKQGSEFLWGISREEQIHERLFASVTAVDLNLTELRSEQLTEARHVGVYNYDLSVELPTEQVLLAQGQVEFEFVKDAQERWRIQSFSDLKDRFSKSAQGVFIATATEDSVDYFPLRVGHKWNYEEILFNMPGYETIVTDSLILRGKLYYSLKDFVFPFFMQPTFARVDSFGEFKMFFPADSSELTIFKFNAAVGDTWSFQPPGNLNFPTTVELIARKDSLKVPAGTFKNVLEYLLTINFSTRVLYEFGENIGMIRQRGENQELVLKNAFINGDIIVSVNTKQYSWTQIKMGF